MADCYVRPLANAKKRSATHDRRLSLSSEDHEKLEELAGHQLRSSVDVIRFLIREAHKKMRREVE